MHRTNSESTSADHGWVDGISGAGISVVAVFVRNDRKVDALQSLGDDAARLSDSFH